MYFLEVSSGTLIDRCIHVFDMGGGLLPLPGLAQIPEGSQPLPKSALFKRKPAHPEPTPQDTSFIVSLGLCPPAPITSGPGTTQRGHPCPRTC